MSEFTLGGYIEAHQRSPGFTGADGAPYSAAIYVDDEPDARGFYGAAVLFVRWSAGGDRPVGHVETEYLAWGRDPDEARERIGALSLYDVKAALDEAITRRPADW